MSEPLFPHGDYPTVFHALEAIWAYDQGATDSGVHDEVLRQRCVKAIDGLRAAPVRDGTGEDSLRVALALWCRERYLSGEALAAGYGMEDAAEFCEWIDSGAFRRGG